MPETAAQGRDARAEQAPILVVDDDRLVRQAIRWALEDEGLQVETVADGHQALKRLAQRKPALVVLDLTLPLHSGDEVAAAVRAAYGAVPILVITADGHAAAKAQRMGAIGYLHKPFEIETLIRAVQRGLRAV